MEMYVDANLPLGMEVDVNRRVGIEVDDMTLMYIRYEL